MTVRSGDDVALQCQATGEPAPTIEWLRAGRTLRASRRLRTLPDGSLWLKRVEAGDAGVYECIAHNLLGSAMARALLVVRGRGRPSPDLQGQRGALLYRGLLMRLAHWGPGLLPCPPLIPSLSHRRSMNQPGGPSVSSCPACLQSGRLSLRGAVCRLLDRGPWLFPLRWHRRVSSAPFTSP